MRINEMENRKILPLGIPEIKTNPFITNRLAVIRPHKESKEWFLSSFYNFWICRDVLKHKGYWGDLLYHGSYRFCPFLFEGMIAKELIQSKWKDNIVEFVLDIIDSGQYIYLNINASCIPYYFYKPEENIVHDMLVFGYDKEKEMLLAVDFFGGEYKSQEISFEMFKTAYHNLYLGKKEDFLNGVCTLKYIDAKFSFKLDDCVKGLEDYLGSRNTQIQSLLTELDYDEDVYFGIDCYDGFIDYLNAIEKSGEEVEYRQFHYFYMHKIVMRERVQYLSVNQYLFKNNEELIESFKNIELFWQRIRNSILRYNMRKNETFFSKMKEELGKEKIFERECIKMLLESIDAEKSRMIK